MCWGHIFFPQGLAALFLAYFVWKANRLMHCFDRNNALVILLLFAWLQVVCLPLDVAQSSQLGFVGSERIGPEDDLRKCCVTQHVELRVEL